jgi:Zn-finger nucleic acid-binding protein
MIRDGRDKEIGVATGLETGAATISCPRCSNPLQEGAIHGVRVFKCPGCQGLLLQSWSLPKLLEKLAREIGAAFDLEEPLGVVPDKGSVLVCPRCGGPTEHHGYQEGHSVYIDSCSECGDLWLDTDELAAMCQIDAQTNHRLAQRHIENKKRIEDLDQVFDALYQSQANKHDRPAPPKDESIVKLLIKLFKLFVKE